MFDFLKRFLKEEEPEVLTRDGDDFEWDDIFDLDLEQQEHFSFEFFDFLECDE